MLHCCFSFFFSFHVFEFIFIFVIWNLSYVCPIVQPLWLKSNLLVFVSANIFLYR